VELAANGQVRLREPWPWQDFAAPPTHPGQQQGRVGAARNSHFTVFKYPRVLRRIGGFLNEWVAIKRLPFHARQRTKGQLASS
jgi:hypothetical protein